MLKRSGKPDTGTAAAHRASTSGFARNAGIFITAFAVCLLFLSALDVTRAGNIVNVSIVNAPPPTTLPANNGPADDIWTTTSSSDPEAEDEDTRSSALEDLSVQVSRLGSVLPRTSSRPYNVLQPGERYFLYSPGGGFNNQLIEFFAGIFLAKKFNRTLIVPPAGRHANKDTGYYALGRDETVPMDHVLDLEYISRALDVPLLPLNMTLQDFHVLQLGGKSNSNRRVTYIKWPGIMLFATAGIRKRFLRDIEEAGSAPVVFAKGHFFNQYFARNEYWNHLRYAPYLSKLSLLIADELMGPDFDTYHMRLGDYNTLAHSFARNARGMVRTGVAHGLSRDRPLYLATDGKVRRDDGKLTPWYAPFERFKRLVTQAELTGNARVLAALSEFKARMPPSSIYMTVFGIVEQLVCARARTFVGTHMSTFTQTILRLREQIPTTVPDMVVARANGAIAWEVGGTFKAQWDGRTTWRDVTCNLTTAQPNELCERGAHSQDGD